MGLDVYAKIVVGLPLDVVYSKGEIVRNQVKKFNENTGEPYFKDVFTKSFTLFGQKYVNDNFCLENEIGKFDDGLEIHKYSCDTAAQNIIGFEVYDMGGRCEDEYFKQIDQAKICDAKQKFFDTTGFDANVYLTMYYSY